MRRRAKLPSEASSDHKGFRNLPTVLKKRGELIEDWRCWKAPGDCDIGSAVCQNGLNIKEIYRNIQSGRVNIRSEMALIKPELEKMMARLRCERIPNIPLVNRAEYLIGHYFRFSSACGMEENIGACRRERTARDAEGIVEIHQVPSVSQI